MTELYSWFAKMLMDEKEIFKETPVGTELSIQLNDNINISIEINQTIFC